MKKSFLLSALFLGLMSWIQPAFAQNTDALIYHHNLANTSVISWNNVATWNEGILNFVPYRIVPSYAVKEKYAGKNSTKITSKSKLNKEFTRVLMHNENPAMSEINFSNEMVIAISEKGLPIGTVLRPVSVTEQGGKNLLLVYEVSRTNNTGVYNPLFLIALDKKYKNYKLNISRRVI